jgi:hypothetical protein
VGAAIGRPADDFFWETHTVSIVRVGLSSDKFASGYDAIFGSKKKPPAKTKKAAPKAKKTTKKKK